MPTLPTTPAAMPAAIAKKMRLCVIRNDKPLYICRDYCDEGIVSRAAGSCETYANDSCCAFASIARIERSLFAGVRCAVDGCAAAC